MKDVTSITVLLVCCIQLTTVSAEPLSTAEQATCDSLYSCMDCTTGRVCAPHSDGRTLYELLQFSCPTDRPYCSPSTGSCSADKPSSCPVHASTEFIPPATATVPTSFTCMRNGYFPDPRNCSVYYSCEQYTPDVHHCTGDMPYYSTMKYDCTWNDGVCLSKSRICEGKHGVKVSFSRPSLPDDYRYFAYCVDEVILTVDRCIGMNFFNDSSQLCEPSCRTEGWFPRVDDCTKYYRCAPASTSLSTYFDGDSQMLTDQLTCPQGQGFLESAYQCVDQALVPNCNVSSPSLFN